MSHGSGQDGRAGLALLVGASHVSYERLPMVEIVADRLRRFMTTTMRAYTSDAVEIALQSAGSRRFGDIVRGIAGDALFATFRAEEWENDGLVILSSPMVYLILEALLGGGGRVSSGERRDWSARRHTTIERALVEPVIREILADLGRAFGPLCAVTFRLDRLEVNGRFAAVARSTDGAVLLRFSVGVGPGTGEIDFVLPHATLEPVRDVLLQQFVGEKFGGDESWEQHFAAELRHVEMELDVVLDEETVSLGEILALKPGARLILHTRAGSPVRLRCGTRDLFEGRVGHRKGRAAFRIENRIEPERLDELAAAMLLAGEEDGDG